MGIRVREDEGVSVAVKHHWVTVTLRCQCEYCEERKSKAKLRFQGKILRIRSHSLSLGTGDFFFCGHCDFTRRVSKRKEGAGWVTDGLIKLFLILLRSSPAYYHNELPRLCFQVLAMTAVHTLTSEQDGGHFLSPKGQRFDPDEMDEGVHASLSEMLTYSCWLPVFWGHFQPNWEASGC